MLSRRLTSVLAVCGALLLAACGGGDEIEDAVVRPGITAMEDADSAACAANQTTLRVAIDAYTVLEGEPPPNEAALVEAQFLRAETTDWDVVDGEIVAENPACGDPAEVTPIDDIVTSTIASPTAEEFLASWSDEQIDGEKLPPLRPDYLDDTSERGSPLSAKAARPQRSSDPIDPP